MKILSALTKWLISRGDQKAGNLPFSDPRSARLRNGSAQPDFHLNFLRLNDYFGPCHRSSSGRWALSWLDSAPTGGRGGHRETGDGFFVLYDTEQGRIVTEGNLQRPNNGHVADNGSFSIEDWHFGGDLSGTLHVFDHEGSLLLARSVTANIVDSAISGNGQYAICQTANSPTEDGNKLFLFDVATGRELYKVSPSAGWPERYEIDNQTGHVIAHIKDVGAFRYDQQGQLIGAEDIVGARLRSPRYDVALLAAEQLLKGGELTNDDANQILESVALFRGKHPDAQDSWKAIAFKVEGFVYTAKGESSKAISAFDAALALNPKIGVKRKRDALARRSRLE